MKILISGASGLIGSSLAFALDAAGHSLNRLVRDESRGAAGDVVWNPATGAIAASALAPFDAIVHLAGESIAAGRWTAEKKERIRASRVHGTRVLAEALAKLPPRPRTLMSASAIGFYGNRDDELLDESSSPGNDFLAEVCQSWEAAAEPAAKAGVRVVHPRFGVVLSGQGGALKKMLLPFRLGLGGRIGSGRQYMSWVALDDVVGAIIHALDAAALRGAVNVVAPNPVTNLEFTKTLGRVLSRPTIFPMPAVVARAAFGEMADALLLSSQRVRPAKLQAAGYAFKFPTLAGALRHVLLPL
ncbi:MAG TPA: TIGR01777 family oxidoreductase [Pirellulales bacterium]|nr:TIGR01777 family oxidoreductase [Pirellulales bacterium]